MTFTRAPLLYIVPMRPAEHYDPLYESMIGHVDCNPGWEQEVEDEYEEEENNNNDDSEDDMVNPSFKRQYTKVDQDGNRHADGF